MSDFVRIVEVGPRDGLQNEAQPIATADKIALIDQLSATGLRTIEATSFVSPRWVPQLADAAEVFAGIAQAPGIEYPVLVPNLQGYERARAAGAQEVAVFTAASEAFNRTNTNAGIDESIERFRPILQQAALDGIRVRGYVSTVLGCPYQGEVPVTDVVDVAQRLHALGCYEISLGDTIGVGTPVKARRMLAAVAQAVPMPALAVHFHDTYGQALANIAACLGKGVRVIDAAVSGAGGCPYARAPAATWPAKTWCTCCRGWACPPASTCPPWPAPAAGWRGCSVATPAARSARRWLPPAEICLPAHRASPTTAITQGLGLEWPTAPPIVRCRHHRPSTRLREPPHAAIFCPCHRDRRRLRPRPGCRTASRGRRRQGRAVRCQRRQGRGGAGAARCRQRALPRHRCHR